MEGLVNISAKIPVEINDMEIFQDTEVSRIWKLNITHSKSLKHKCKKIIIFKSIQTMRLCTSMTDFNTKPYNI